MLPNKLQERIEKIAIVEIPVAFRFGDNQPAIKIDDFGKAIYLHGINFGATTIATELWAEIEELRGKLEYIDEVRYRKCQSEGCTCAYDTAHMALTKHREKWGE